MFYIREKREDFKGINGDSIIDILEKIRETVGPKHKCAVFLDNASIHRTKKVRAASEKYDIPLVFNIPYSP